MQINVEFSVVDWQESELKKLQADTLKQATVKYQYKGDVVGNSDAEFLLLYQANGSAVFSAVEKVTGDYKGETFELHLTHHGQHAAGVAKGKCEVQYCSGSLSELLGATGEYKADASTVKLTLSND